MDAFGKYTHFADASRLRTWIRTGKVMPVPAATLSYKSKAAQMAAAGSATGEQTAQKRLNRRLAKLGKPGNVSDGAYAYRA